MNPIKVTQKITSTPVIPAMKDSGREVMQNITASAQEFIERLSNTHTNEILEFLEKNTKKIKTRSADDSLYLYNNILLYRAPGAKSYDLEQNLKTLKDSPIAPQFIKYFRLGEEDFLTVMQVSEKSVSSYADAPQKVLSSAKEDFRRSMTDLINRGFVNRDVFANKEALLSADGGKNLVFADWSSLQPIDKNEIPIYMGRIRALAL
ncbi:hypothetical protein IKP85_04205 [bacterium]|nr:hypothetical protein [bacterium]